MAKKTEVTIKWNGNKAGAARYKDEAYKMFYTRVMRGEKRLKGEVDEMSPEKFLKCDLIKNKPDPKCVASTKINMQQGRMISIPVIDYVHGYIDGKHRVLAAKELGAVSIPVLICGKPKKTEK